jgi:hypothetical protein
MSPYNVGILFFFCGNGILLGPVRLTGQENIGTKNFKGIGNDLSCKTDEYKTKETVQAWAFGASIVLLVKI